jgi:hypothetical protein
METAKMPKHRLVKEREAVTRDIFETIAAMGFQTWREQYPQDVEKALDEGSTLDQLREQYVHAFEKIAWAELKEMAKSASYSQLLNVREEWIERADALGMMQWQQAKDNGTKKPIERRPAVKEPEQDIDLDR